jgi:hypothetical protein
LARGLEPVGDLVEAFGTGVFRHARVHVGVLVGLAGNGGLQVIGGRAEGQAGGGVAALLEILEVAVRVAGLAFRRGAEQRGDVSVAFDVGLVCEIQIATVGL